MRAARRDSGPSSTNQPFAPLGCCHHDAMTLVPRVWVIRDSVSAVARASERRRLSEPKRKSPWT
jgi:hypothetical protein